MKYRTKLITIGCFIALGFGVCGYTLASFQHGQVDSRDNRVHYIDDSESSNIEQFSSNEESSKAQTAKLNSEEGIDAEQIVVKITDDGYVTSHGDHFHYYSGKVPYDALISEELVMKDPNYKFKKEDIVSEHENGYIIKVNGKYYLYLTDPQNATNIRTKAEIIEQQKGTKDKGIMTDSGHKNKEGRYTTDDGYVFTPESIVEDTGDAFIVSHGDHFHYVPKADLSSWELELANKWLSGKGISSVHIPKIQNTSIVRDRDGNMVDLKSNYNDNYFNSKENLNQGIHIYPNNIISKTSTHHGPVRKSSNVNTSSLSNNAIGNAMDKWYKLPESQRHKEKDGLVFDPRIVIERKAFGYVLPHGDHYHIIPFSQLSKIEIEAAEAVINAKQRGIKIPSQKELSQNKKDEKINKKRIFHKFFGNNIEAYGKGLDGKPYFTSDGYTFTASSIIDVDEHGVVAKHDDHIHYFGLGELEQNELAMVEKWTKENKKTMASSEVNIDDEKPAFDHNKIISKNKNMYVVKNNNQIYRYSSESLDLNQRAFAELKISELNNGNYKFSIVPPKDGELAPALLVNADQLPMHVGNATIDTGKEFIIPHIDHIHVVRYYQLKPEELATVKYLMQNPEVRPDPWTIAHGSEDQTDKYSQLKYIVNVTPKEERTNLKNWQIIHSVEEVKQAWREGRYATTTGYIFSPQDILDEQTYIWRDSYTIPTAYGILMDIPKSDLSTNELEMAIQVEEKIKEKKINKEKKDFVNKVDFPQYKEKNEIIDTDISEKRFDGSVSDDLESSLANESKIGELKSETSLEKDIQNEDQTLDSSDSFIENKENVEEEIKNPIQITESDKANYEIEDNKNN